MTTFTVQISTGQQYTFAREQFAKCFPVGFITEAIPTDETLILSEPSVTAEVMAMLQFIVNPKDDFKVTPEFREILRRADLYLGTLALTLIANDDIFVDLPSSSLEMTAYTDMLDKMTKQPKLTLCQYFFARFAPGETKVYDQQCLETVVEKHVEATTPFFKLLLQRDVNPSLNDNALLKRCLTTGQFSKAKLLLRNALVMECLDVSGALLMHIKRGCNEEIIDRLLILLGRPLTTVEMLAITMTARHHIPEYIDMLIARGVNMAQFNYGWLGQLNDDIGSYDFRVFLKYRDFDVSMGSNALLVDNIRDYDWDMARCVIQHPKFNPNVLSVLRLHESIPRMHKSDLMELVDVITLWQKHPHIRPDIQTTLAGLIKMAQDKSSEPNPIDKFGFRALSPNDEAYFVPLPHFD